MKNIFRRVMGMLAVAFVAATSLTMVACSEEEVAEPKRLATPDVDVIYRSESFDVMWKAVEGADGYVYSLNGAEEQTTTETSLKFAGLKFGSANTLKVKAVDSSKAFADSQWGVVSLTLNTAFNLGQITLAVSDQTASSFVVSWNAAEGAEYYEVALGNGAAEKVTGLQKEFTGLAEGAYTVKVRPATTDADYAEAAWVSITAKTQETIADTEASNCYLIEEAGAFAFAPFKGNSGEAVEGVAGAALLWQDAQGLITSVDFVDSKVTFAVAEGVYGNAVIYAYGDAGNEVALWSWHIWVPEQKVEALGSITGFALMNMNLGATTPAAGDVGCYGLYYQWGRKDPFASSPTLTGTTATLHAQLYNIDNEEIDFPTSATQQSVEYSIANPAVYIRATKTYDDWCIESDSTLWGNGEGHIREEGTLNYNNMGVKSMYDPCPAGWRVPPIQATSNLTAATGIVFSYDQTSIVDRNGDGKVDKNDYNGGYYFKVSGNTVTYFPGAARWDGTYGMLYGSIAGHVGNYWSNSIYKSTLASQKDSKMATAGVMFFSPTMAGNCYVSDNAGAARADAYSIRCVADL
ncbi:MAG: hypothetical protein IKT94_06060 [Rikenellaceae bacterium]|nr:hypothetical protein [Rikenellaceae bacterium]